MRDLLFYNKYPACYNRFICKYLFVNQLSHNIRICWYVAQVTAERENLPFVMKFVGDYVGKQFQWRSGNPIVIDAERKGMEISVVKLLQKLGYQCIDGIKEVAALFYRGDLFIRGKIHGSA